MHQIQCIEMMRGWEYGNIEVKADPVQRRGEKKGRTGIARRGKPVADCTDGVGICIGFGQCRILSSNVEVQPSNGDDLAHDLSRLNSMECIKVMVSDSVAG